MDEAAPAFLTFFERLSLLGEDARRALADRVVAKTYVKKAVVLDVGDVCQRIYFVESGLVKIYYERESTDVILRFFAEGSPFTILDSFIEQAPSIYRVMTLEDSRIVSVAREDLEVLSSRHRTIETAYRKLISMACVNVMRRLHEMMNSSATQRYASFREENRAYLDRIKLGDVAAYLGISQVSLSRIRAKR